MRRRKDYEQSVRLTDDSFGLLKNSINTKNFIFTPSLKVNKHNYIDNLGVLGLGNSRQH